MVRVAVSSVRRSVFNDESLGPFPGTFPFIGEDSWNMDMVLAEIIADGIHMFREHVAGHPGTMSYQAWIAVLQQIEDGFRVYPQQREIVTPDDPLRVQFDTAMNLFVKYFSHLWV